MVSSVFKGNDSLFFQLENNIKMRNGPNPQVCFLLHFVLSRLMGGPSWALILILILMGPGKYDKNEKCSESAVIWDSERPVSPQFSP